MIKSIETLIWEEGTRYICVNITFLSLMAFSWTSSNIQAFLFIAVLLSQHLLEIQTPRFLPAVKD